MALSLVLGLVGQARAHKASDATLNIREQGSDLLGVRYSIAIRDLEEVFRDLDANGDRQLTLSELQAAVPQITLWLSSGLDVACERSIAVLRWKFDGVERRSDGAYAVFQADGLNPCRSDQHTFVRYRLMGEVDPEHRLMLSGPQKALSSKAQLSVVAPDNTWTRLEMGGAPAAFSGVGSFIRLGFEHILSGADHIAFVLALVLGVALFEHWRSLLLTLTAFTLGHSITLAVASLGWVASAAWVEPVIALSVGVVALINLFAASWRWLEQPVLRAALGAVFGLVHGLGFSGALTEAQVPAGSMAGALFGFNLGVELGQLAIVGLWACVYSALARRKFYSEWMVPGLSASLLLAAMVWFIERTVGLA
jgi:hydrogenase/urease accessory protein HupE